jgi:Ca-activated chloride channel family protein
MVMKKMAMIRMFSVALVGLAATLAASRLPAQQPQPQQEPNPPAGQTPAPPGKSDQRLVRRVELVNVIATVVNSRQKFITDLEKPDFVIAEDGQAQSIQFFHRETDLPLRVGLLLDTSNSIRERLKFEEEAAIDFLHNTLRRKKDQAFLMIFDNEPSVVQDFTDDLDVLTQTILRQRAGGGTALYDAIALASKKLAEAPTPPGTTYGDVRRVLVVISDGDDNLSNRSRGEAIEMAARGEVAVYCISSSTEWVSASEERDAVKRVERKIHKSDSDKVLDQFADETGGRSFFPYKLDDLSQSFQDIGIELRSQYQLAYSPVNKLFDGKFRRIKVTVGRKGLIVRARRGYFAQRADAGLTPSGPGNLQ